MYYRHRNYVKWKFNSDCFMWLWNDSRRHISILYMSYIVICKQALLCNLPLCILTSKYFKNILLSDISWLQIIQSLRKLVYKNSKCQLNSMSSQVLLFCIFRNDKIIFVSCTNLYVLWAWKKWKFFTYISSFSSSFLHRIDITIQWYYNL